MPRGKLIAEIVLFLCCLLVVGAALIAVAEGFSLLVDAVRAEVSQDRAE